MISHMRDMKGKTELPQCWFDYNMSLTPALPTALCGYIEKVDVMRFPPILIASARKEKIIKLSASKELLAREAKKICNKPKRHKDFLDVELFKMFQQSCIRNRLCKRNSIERRRCWKVKSGRLLNEKLVNSIKTLLLVGDQQLRFV